MKARMRTYFPGGQVALALEAEETSHETTRTFFTLQVSAAGHELVLFLNPEDQTRLFEVLRDHLSNGEREITE